MSKSTETKKARRAEIERKTAETQISIKLNLDGEGNATLQRVSVFWIIC